MKINYNVTGSDRKQLVSIISRETGIKATYKGMPSIPTASTASRSRRTAR